jgi:hypothetical protein
MLVAGVNHVKAGRSCSLHALNPSRVCYDGLETSDYNVCLEAFTLSPLRDSLRLGPYHLMRIAHRPCCCYLAHEQRLPMVRVTSLLDQPSSTAAA